MWTVVIAITGLLAFVGGVPATFLLVRRSIQTPVREQLAAMTIDRDYYRGKCDDLEEEIRKIQARRRW